ncbi:unnamed protein product, partial [Symbiodinium sp. CCMP2456]
VPLAAEPSFSSQGPPGQWPALAQDPPEQSQSPSGQALSPAEAPAEPPRGGQPGLWPDTPAEVPRSPEPGHSESVSSQWPAPGQVAANGPSSNALQWPPSVELASEQWPETAAEASTPIRWPDAPLQVSSETQQATQSPAQEPAAFSSTPPMKAPDDSAEVPVASSPAEAADSAAVRAVAAWPEPTQAMSSADPSSATMDWPSHMQASDGAFGWPAAPVEAEAPVPSSWPSPTEEVSPPSATKASDLTSSATDTQQPKVAVSLPLGSLPSGAKSAEEPEELPSWWPKGS